MKHLLEELPSSDHISTSESTSNLSRDDQEMGSNALPIINGDTTIKNPLSRWFLRGMDPNPARMVLAEVVGTFILMFSVCGIIASTQLMKGEVGLMEYAATAGLTVVVVIFSLGSISGAHVNPAVTIAFATFSHFPWSKVPLYILAQIVGAVLATYVGKSVYGIKPELMATRPLQGCISAFWVELIATFIVVFLATSLLYQHRSMGNLSGFVVGISIGLAVLISGPISGGSMNPARSLGPAIVAWNFKDIWVYIIAPVIGAMAGALMYKVLRIQRLQCSSSSSPDANVPFHSMAFCSVSPS